jgi:hypothetical protein
MDLQFGPGLSDKVGLAVAAPILWVIAGIVAYAYPLGSGLYLAILLWLTRFLFRGAFQSKITCTSEGMSVVNPLREMRTSWSDVESVRRNVKIVVRFRSGGSFAISSYAETRFQGWARRWFGALKERETVYRSILNSFETHRSSYLVGNEEGHCIHWNMPSGQILLLWGVLSAALEILVLEVFR